MGCGSSTSTAVVRPLATGKLQGDEDETGSKHSGRGDSAVSKSTTDSGVVMENREVPTLPGTIPQKLSPLTTAEANPPLVRRVSQSLERQKSSEILEELLNQGIIPMGQVRENSSSAGEAYSIMLNDGEGALRRPPARLEKMNKSPLSKEEIDEKMRLAEERRKQKEDDMKSRLRAKSARVRVPTRSLSTGEEEDQLPALSQVSTSPAEGAEREPEAGDLQPKTPQEKQGDSAEVKERGENDVIPLRPDGELSDADSDVSFQPATANDEIF